MMYFCDPLHEENFNELSFLYGASRPELLELMDPQYLANIYIAAVPEIFKLLIISEELLSRGPLVSLMKYNEKRDELVPAYGGLTGSTTWLLEIGMSLYNGYSCSLDNRPSNEYANVVFQAMEIRYQVLRTKK